MVFKLLLTAQRKQKHTRIITTLTRRGIITRYTEFFFRSRIKPHRFVTDSRYEMCLCIIETRSPDGGSLTTGYQPATAASPGALINDRSQHIKYTWSERCYGGLQKCKRRQFLQTDRQQCAHLWLEVGKSLWVHGKKVLTSPSTRCTSFCLHMLRQEHHLKRGSS